MPPFLDVSALSPEEIKRIQIRRKMARSTPAQREKLLQYQRRHNEKDGRLYYCDYCDFFVSSQEKSWSKHLATNRHRESMRAYYYLVEQEEKEKVKKLDEAVLLARKTAEMKVKNESDAGNDTVKESVIRSTPLKGKKGKDGKMSFPYDANADNPSSLEWE